VYPRSEVFRVVLSSYSCNIEDIGMAQLFNALASAGDYSESQDSNLRDGAIRRTAKTLLEWDRVLWLKSQNFSVKLCKMDPIEASPKNDIIIGYYKGSCSNKSNSNGKDTHSYSLKMASHYLLGSSP